MASSTTPLAMDAVLHLPELLEIVLSNLSQKDLLLAQRVNTIFRDTIRCSNRLQRALFILPDWKLEARVFNAYAACNRPGDKPENNRLLLRAFPGCYPTVTLVITTSNDETVSTLSRSSSTSSNSSASSVDLLSSSPTSTISLASDISQSSAESRGSMRTSQEHWSWDVCISFPADAIPQCSPAVHYPEASWRKMYLSQPPCTTLHLVRRWQRSIKPAIVREHGITMGEFVEEATKTQANWHRSYISSDRDWHFEGNIKCSSVRDDQPKKAAARLEDEFMYAHSRDFRHGLTLRTLSDDWSPEQILGVVGVIHAQA